MINVNYKLLNKEIVFYSSKDKKTYLDYKKQFFLIRNKNIDLVSFLKENLDKADPAYMTRAVLLSTMDRKKDLPFLGYMINHILQQLQELDSKVFDKYKILIYNGEKQINFAKLFLDNVKLFLNLDSNEEIILNAEYITSEVKKHLQHYAEIYNNEKFESTVWTNVLNNIFYFFQGITKLETIEDIVLYQKNIFCELFIVYFETVFESYQHSENGDGNEMVKLLIKNQIFANVNASIISFLEKNT